MEKTDGYIVRLWLWFWPCLWFWFWFESLKHHAHIAIEDPTNEIVFLAKLGLNEKNIKKNKIQAKYGTMAEINA